ncbi:MAG: PIN domain-containing protein [Anaerolineae bacterium]|nr:PIN domain-containing protein [Anaerolineae bacterium]
MRISAALAPVNRLYVDTSPLIYYVELHPHYIARMDAVIARIKSPSIEGVCSVITLAEVLPVPLRMRRFDLVADYRAILLNSREIRCVPVSAGIAAAAAELRSRHNLKTPDALHLAIAIETGCDAFLSNDLDLKRVTAIQVLILDELEIDLP